MSKHVWKGAEVRLGVRSGGEAEEIFGRLLRMMVTRDERLVALASRWFDLDDLLDLYARAQQHAQTRFESAAR